MREANEDGEACVLAGVPRRTGAGGAACDAGKDANAFLNGVIRSSTIAPFAAVIRPQPLRLVDIERRMMVDPEFTRAMAQDARFVEKIASALHVRCPEAKRKFGSAAEVAERLMSLRLQ